MEALDIGTMEEFKESYRWVYPLFERGYEALKAATAGFKELIPDKVLSIVVREPIALMVLRSMLGFTLLSGAI